MTDHINTEVRRIEAHENRLVGSVEHDPHHYAEQEAPRSTRDQSPRRPMDHKRSKREPIIIEFAGEVFEIDGRAPNHIPTMFALRNNDFETVLTNMIGDDGLKRVIEYLTDEDGYSDFEELGEIVSEIYKKAGSKNS